MANSVSENYTRQTQSSESEKWAAWIPVFILQQKRPEWPVTLSLKPKLLLCEMELGGQQFQ